MAGRYYAAKDGTFTLYCGDVRDGLHHLHGSSFDMVFADPPYFLSNGGFSVRSGVPVSVNKGAWDASKGHDADKAFTVDWLTACRDVMSESATIWICGTYHNIFTVAEGLKELDFRILNVVTWQKSNPPPNLSCRFFTHSTEFLIWARKRKSVPHRYNYELMRKIAGGQQMTDVWRMPAISPWEKACGKHPTQKPVALVARAIMACTETGAIVLDPFAGSGTTGIAANLLGRNFVGIDSNMEYLQMARERRRCLEANREAWQSRIPDLKAIC